MIACGSLADATLVPRYEALLFPKDSLATSGRGRRGRVRRLGPRAMADPRALPCCGAWRAGPRRIAALAVLGLAWARHVLTAAIAEIARSVDAGTLTRAAAGAPLASSTRRASARVIESPRRRVLHGVWRSWRSRG